MALGWANNSMTGVCVVFRHVPNRRLVNWDMAVVFLGSDLDGAILFPIRSALGDLGPRSLLTEQAHRFSDW
jgi:hypothetical protein